MGLLCHILLFKTWAFCHSFSNRHIYSTRSSLQKHFQGIIPQGLKQDSLFKSVMNIMKPSGIWVLLLMLGAALICISYSCKTCAPKSTDMTDAVTSRKLKYLDHRQVSGKSNAGFISPQDYGPVDPVPSSKASIQAGPIQHDTPLMPCIPPSRPAPSSP